MPISKTTAGLILLEEFDDLSSWTVWTYNFSPSWGSYDLSIDTGDKQSGAGALVTHYKTWLVGTGSYFCTLKTLNWGSGAGRRVHRGVRRRVTWAELHTMWQVINLRKPKSRPYLGIHEPVQLISPSGAPSYADLLDGSWSALSAGFLYLRE